MVLCASPKHIPACRSVFINPETFSDMHVGRRIYQTLTSADAGCHDGGPLLVRSPIPVGEALMMPTDFCLK